MAEVDNISSFVAPLWWLQAFENSLQMRTLEASPVLMSLSSRLSPAFTDAEMNALLVIMRSAQSQILSGHKWLYLAPEGLQKNNAYNTRTKSFLFLRVIQLLKSIQLTGCVGQDEIDPIALFEREEKRRDSQGNWKSMFKLAPMATELILGYCEPYSELVRLLDGKPRAHRLLGNFSPMQLRPSIWLELSQLEQYVFLQIQKASEWDKAPMRWDSVFGKGFDDLFWNLELNKSSKANSELSPFARKLKLLKRTGRKLSDQGLIRTLQELDYLAIDHDSDPLAVVWQVSDQLVNLKERAQYEANCVSYFRDHSLELTIKKLISVLASTGKKNPDAATNLWREIEELKKELEFDHVRIEGNLLFCTSALYFEWSLRSKAENILQLPGWLKDSPAVQVFEQRKSLSEKLILFNKIIVEQEEYQRDLELIPRVSFAAPVSLRQHEVLEYLATHTAKNIGKEASQGNTETIPKTSPKASVNSQVTTPPRVVSDIEQRKKASDELVRIREKDPKRYQTLKQSYLETLDVERKQIILEMKERMQPSAFDDHLRYSLVKYMVENPGVWFQEDVTSQRFF